MIEQYEYRTDILTCIQDRMIYMIAHHCKVFFVRFDARLPEGYLHDGGNREISQLMKALKEFYAYQGVEMHYVWVREQVSSPVPHYHVVLLVNGSLIQNATGIWAKAQKLWSRITGGPNGLIHHCWPTRKGLSGIGGIMIRRPSGVATGPQLLLQQQEYNATWSAAQESAAYLAKTYSKGNAPHRVREYGASQL
ncbi:YagK/YfjJ domain-containing protein [Azospirillum argentinense]|uniref:YagK/YfjJ C-terminal domain-containing protein n=1 Tax=Azospirillum argentinense TaxID=2970906 RepID=A0A5B0KS46_9PROT|nr:inovirus-type Gp2 protein [Azospirillum argentinense]KAA1054440.1 hypothetical protein FH063_006696 [Azospirillum argentinense]